MIPLRGKVTTTVKRTLTSTRTVNWRVTDNIKKEDNDYNKKVTENGITKRGH